MDKMINLKINGMDVSVPAGSTILEAARQVGIEIPTLCFMKEMNEIGACRICHWMGVFHLLLQYWIWFFHIGSVGSQCDYFP